MSLSPGRWFETVPKSYGANLRFRRKLLDVTCRSEANRKAIWQVCKEDLLFYINAFGWIYEPRPSVSGQSNIPFITYGFQDRALRLVLSAIESGRNLVIEKSRTMGASWFCLYAFEWLWKFHRGKKFLMVSKDEAAVDTRGDMDSLFAKVDFIHDHQPDWMRPPDYEPKKHRRNMVFENPSMYSGMTGAASSQAAGVSGRATGIYLDEFSRMKNAKPILMGTASTTHCRIFTFTAWPGDVEAQKLTQNESYLQLRLHWSEHPIYSRGLYQFKKELGRVEAFDDYRFPEDYHFVMDGKLRSVARDQYEKDYGPQQAAINWDIDFQGASAQFFDMVMISDRVAECRPPSWEGDVELGFAGEPGRFVRREGGPLKLWCPLDQEGNPPRDTYAMGFDLSWGATAKASNSVGSVYSATTGEKVGMYCHNATKPDLMAEKAMVMGKLFCDEGNRPAKMCWERSGPGDTFEATILDGKYQNLWYEEDKIKSRRAERPGWYPENDTRPTVLGAYQKALHTGQCTNFSESALLECGLFVYKNNTVEHSGAKSDDPTASAGAHGDMVIADALGWLVVEDLNVLRTLKAEAKKAEVPMMSVQWFHDRYKRSKHAGRY